MMSSKVKAGVVLGTGTTMMLVGQALPAAATYLDQTFPGPSGCYIRAILWDTDRQGATGQVNETGNIEACNQVWVSLHYTDSKGADKVREAYGASVAITSPGGEGSTVRWGCVAARSSATGTWGTVRHMGSSGPCGAP